MNDSLAAAGEEYLVPFWWYKLNNDPSYTAALKARWAEYRRANLRLDRVMAEIDSLTNVLTTCGAEARNSEAWPRWGEYIWPNYYIPDDFDDAIGYLKEWLTGRIAWMDEQLGYQPDSVERGDANGDGEINVSDVTSLIAYLLNEGDEVVSIEFAAADCNLDGDVNVGDITELINYLLNGSWPDQ